MKQRENFVKFLKDVTKICAKDRIVQTIQPMNLQNNLLKTTQNVIWHRPQRIEFGALNVHFQD